MHTGRGEEKTQHGIETAVPALTLCEFGTVAARRKPSTGLKLVRADVGFRETRGRGEEKTQHGIETATETISPARELLSRRGENPARD